MPRRKPKATAYQKDRDQRAGASVPGSGHVPESCPTCGVEPRERSRCKVCGEPTWVWEHTGDHYKWGREVTTACRCVKGHKPRIGPDGVDRGQIATPEMAKKAAENLAKGMKVTRALMDAGYPRSIASRGKKAISRQIRAELKTMGRKYIEMGRDLSPEDQEQLVRGMLYENVVLKTDKGVMSAKQLGADKRVAMWQPESTANLIVLQAPQVKEVSHPVPLLPSEHPEDLEVEGE